MTNPFDILSAEIIAIRANNPTLSEAIPLEAGWLDIGLPSSAGPYPCIRVDNIENVGGKQNKYVAIVKIWSKDMSYQFYALPEAFKAELENSQVMFTDGYLDRSETGLACAQFIVYLTA